MRKGFLFGLFISVVSSSLLHADRVSEPQGIVAPGYGPRPAPEYVPTPPSGPAYSPPPPPGLVDESESFVPPQEVEIIAPLPRAWRPFYRPCPPGSFFIPSYWDWNGARWVWVTRNVCEFRPGFIYIPPHYGRRGRFRPGHWVPARWHRRYYEPGSPDYRPYPPMPPRRRGW